MLADMIETVFIRLILRWPELSHNHHRRRLFFASVHSTNLSTLLAYRVNLQTMFKHVIATRIRNSYLWILQKKISTITLLFSSSFTRVIWVKAGLKVTRTIHYNFAFQSAYVN